MTNFAIQLPSDGLYEPTVPGGDFFPRVRSLVEEVINSLQTHVSIPENTNPAWWLRDRVELIKRLTGWSNRSLSSYLGTTHPTLGAILAGRQPTRARIPELPGRIAALANLADRLMNVVGDPTAVGVALTTTPFGETRSAREFLIEGDSGRAYIAALDVIRPPTNDGFMRSEWAKPSEHAATVEIDPR